MAFFSSPFKINSNKSINCDLSKYPKIFWAEFKSSSLSLSKLNKALSSKDNASLTDPSEIFTISLKASSDIFPFSLSLIFFINSNNSPDLTLDKSNLWHLETTVIGIFLISVVAKINFKPPPFSYWGGSSKVFNKALNACLLSMCTSSIINILYFDVFGPYLENSMRSLTSSTPVLLAASISRTSMWLELVIASQLSHKSSLHILSIPFVQLRDLATILAIVVLPTPRIPVKRYALGTLFALIEFMMVSAITSCPINSKKFCGLYLRANTLEFLFIIKWGD